MQTFLAGYGLHSSNRRREWTLAGVILLLLVLQLQLILSVRRNSITWDEAHHLFSGYMTWKQADYGLNPEVPPLVKMLAATPLLHLPLHIPKLQGRPFQTECFLDGKDFVFKNNASQVLFRARMAASALMLLLALLVFFAAQEMFGAGAALFALALLAFDPNFLAHGALVTTDVGSACFIFATLYAFYRYVKAPSWSRLVLVGVATGLALVTKFTGILVLPMMVLLAACEVATNSRTRDLVQEANLSRKKLTLRLVGAMVAVGVIALAVLWAFYWFRYQARANGLEMHPSLAEYAQRLSSPRDVRIVTALAHMHLLPESYIYGLVNTKITADIDTSYFFGRVYPHGTWLYFPAALLIKSTLPFLVLVLLAVIAIVTHKLHRLREILFLTVPPALYFLVAMSNHMDIGVRHLLPIYPFLYVLGAGAAWAYLRQDMRWKYAIAALLLVQIVTSVRVFPAYMAYANEAWGGPANTHKYLSDANTDWGQQLIATKQYLDKHNVHHCWFAYFPAGAIDPADYGIPCKPLPTTGTLWWMDIQPIVPAVIDGPVLISDSDLAGIEFGEGALNPYEQFRNIKPTAVIQYGIDVYDGHFEIPLAAGLTHAQKAVDFLAVKQLPQALYEAQQAVALAPNSVNTQATLGDVLTAMNDPEKARVHYETALNLAQTIEPQLQQGWIEPLKKDLRQKATTLYRRSF